MGGATSHSVTAFCNNPLADENEAEEASVTPSCAPAAFVLATCSDLIYLSYLLSRSAFLLPRIGWDRCVQIYDTVAPAGRDLSNEHGARHSGYDTAAVRAARVIPAHQFPGTVHISPIRSCAEREKKA